MCFVCLLKIYVLIMSQISVAITFLMLIIVCESRSTVELQQLSPTIRLNNGYKIPVIGLGTFETSGGDVGQAVKDAIDVGYRHIDTAFLYKNEAEIGSAVRSKIREGVIKREDIFITTKLWNTFHDDEYVEKAFQRSFENLDLGYIDLYLLHYPIAYSRVVENSRLPADDVNAFYPFPFENGASIGCVTSQILYHVFSATRLFCKTAKDDIDFVDTWKAMEKLVQSGRVRSIGLSNFNSEQIDRILSNAMIKPVTNQVECHPNLNQQKLIKFCAARNITITAFSPLGRPHTPGGQRLAISDRRVSELANKYVKTPAQIILRYTLQNGAIVIPKATSKKHIIENFDIFDFQLTEADREIMHTLNNNHRLIAYEGDKDSKYYPFNIEF